MKKAITLMIMMQSLLLSSETLPTIVGLAGFEKQGSITKVQSDLTEDLLRTALVKNRSIKVIPMGHDRGLLLREMEIQQAGFSGEKMKIDPSQFLGAEKIIRGKVSRLAGTYYVSIHVIDTRSGIYDFSRKVTLCSTSELEASMERLARSIAKGFKGDYYNPETTKICTSRLQQKTEMITTSKSAEKLHVARITASSALYEPGFDHSPWTVNDGVVETAWSDGKKKKSARGEWLHLSFKSSVTVDSLVIINGLGLIRGKWGNLYKKNAAVKKAEIKYSNGKSETVSLRHTAEPQRILLSGAKGISSLRFTILEEYPGSRYKDTCISELKFYGKNR